MSKGQKTVSPKVPTYFWVFRPNSGFDPTTFHIRYFPKELTPPWIIYYCIISFPGGGEYFWTIPYVEGGGVETRIWSKNPKVCGYFWTHYFLAFLTHNYTFWRSLGFISLNANLEKHLFYVFSSYTDIFASGILICYYI